MKITILCSSKNHPVNEALYQWMRSNDGSHDVRLVRSKNELHGGDILFLISCSELVSAQDREKFKKVLVIHASDLPKGRGWSPHIWEVINGASGVVICLLEAQDKVDSGDVWNKLWVNIPRHALYNEINDLLFAAECHLMDFSIKNFHTIKPESQNVGTEPSYHPRRAPADSELDPEKSIASQFDLLRVCDPERFPAFFKLHGHAYKLVIEKMNNE